MSAPLPRTYSFGSFRVDAGRRVLQTAAGDVVELSSRAFDALLYLIENPGRLIEKSEIVEVVWPNVVVEQNNLNQAVFAIRRALGDNAEKPRYIATVPGRGYQFVARVSVLNPSIEPSGDSAPAQLDTVAAPVARRTPRPLGRLSAVSLFAVVALAIALASTVLRAPAPYTLAVLPFRPLIPAESNPSLELGMAETLIRQLSRARGLIVSPYSSVRRYATIDSDPRVAGRELGVQGVLETTIHYSAEGPSRVSLVLYDVASGEGLWELKLDGPFDPLAAQDAIAVEVAARLPDIVGKPDAGALRRATNDPEAYDLYLRGRFEAANRTPESLRRAIDYFTQAIERDPRYSLAYAARADCYAVRAVFGAVEPRAAFGQARADAKRALELDAELAEAHATMGHIHVQYDNDWAAGEREYLQAIDLDPRYAMAHMWLGMLYNYRQEFDKALAYMRMAEQLEPDQPVFSANVGNVLYHARRYEEAVERLQSTLAIDPNFDLALALLGRAYLRMGDFDSALEVLAQRRSPMMGRDADRVQALAAAGRREEAHAVLGVIVERANANESYVSSYDLASAYMGIGDHDRAIEMLGRAFQEHAQHIAHMPADPAFDPLHGDPEFERLVALLKL